MFTTIKYLYKAQGIKVFYRGWIPNVTNISLNATLFYIIYEKYKKIIKLKSENNRMWKHKGFYFLGGGLSRAIANTLTMWLDFLCTYSQAQVPFTELMEQKDLTKKVFKGYKAAVGRNALFSFILWGTYEATKEKVTKSWNKLDYLQNNPKLSILAINTFAATTSSILAGFLTTPMDVLKLRYQIFPHKMRK